jgi:hypothetical protein
MATPNPIPAGNRFGRTTVRWSTGDDSVGQVYVSEDGGPEGLFAQGAHGSQVAGWISDEPVYTFRLYSGAEPRRLLKAITVTRGDGLGDTIVDFVLVLMLLAPVAMVLLGVLAVLRESRRLLWRNR